MTNTTIITEIYTSNNGTKYELQSFDPSTLYSPSEVRAVNASNFEFYAIKKSDKSSDDLREMQAQYELTRPRTRDESYQIALAREVEKKRVEAERLAKEAAAELAKIEFLKSSPDIVNIQESNLHSFLIQVCHWSRKKYDLTDEILVNFPHFFSLTMTKAAK